MEEKIHVRGYKKALRQIAITDLGHTGPTLLITNQMDVPACRLIDRYARRMLIENTLADTIDFFHRDALSSAVPIRIDVDLQLTLMASTAYSPGASEVAWPAPNPAPSFTNWGAVPRSTFSPTTSSLPCHAAPTVHIFWQPDAWKPQNPYPAAKPEAMPTTRMN